MGTNPKCCCHDRFHVHRCCYRAYRVRHPSWGPVGQRFEKELLPEANKVVDGVETVCDCGGPGCPDVHTAKYELDREWLPQANELLQKHGFYADTHAWMTHDGKKPYYFLMIRIFLDESKPNPITQS